MTIDMEDWKVQVYLHCYRGLKWVALRVAGLIYIAGAVVLLPLAAIVFLIEIFREENPPKRI